MPLWLEAVQRKPNWDAIFDGFESTTDYPACTYWRELTAYYPDAKVILTVRDPDSWFDSVSETIFSEQMMGSLAGTPIEAMMNGVIFDAFDGRVRDRAFMTDWFKRRNQQVIDALLPDRLLVFSPKEGWQPLCSFLGVPCARRAVPARQQPRRNGGGRGEAWRAAVRPGHRRKIRARPHRSAESESVPRGNLIHGSRALPDPHAVLGCDVLRVAFLHVEGGVPSVHVALGD